MATAGQQAISDVTLEPILVQWYLVADVIEKKQCDAIVP
jgi:hypothetical protein